MGMLYCGQKRGMSKDAGIDKILVNNECSALTSFNSLCQLPKKPAWNSELEIAGMATASNSL